MAEVILRQPVLLTKLTWLKLIYSYRTIAKQKNTCSTKDEDTK